MPLRNTATTYGSVAKTFHWLVALLILSNLPLGWIAGTLAEQVAIAPDEALIARTTLLFSLHKTIGVTIFLVALARILWALSQPKPGLLNGDRRIEALAAETVHWLLYGSLVLVPLTGWVHHAATDGFAPIWWPLGQNLPMVPKSEAVSVVASTLHFVFQWVLTVAIAAHVAGALKHHLLDGDATLRRMLPGHAPAAPTARQPGHALPLGAALVLWLAALGGAGALGWFDPSGRPAASALAAVESQWQVESGTIEFTIQQMGAGVSGSFADWTAEIAYSGTPDAEGRHGSVTVTVAIGSLSLGAVTQQAMGADFFHLAEFPTAVFAADLLSTDAGPVARGTLRIRDQDVPVEIPFDLAIEGERASATGAVTVDRRDFGLGRGVTDARSLGFEVGIRFALEATRTR